MPILIDDDLVGAAAEVAEAEGTTTDDVISRWARIGMQFEQQVGRLSDEELLDLRALLADPGPD